VGWAVDVTGQGGTRGPAVPGPEVGSRLFDPAWVENRSHHSLAISRSSASVAGRSEAASAALAIQSSWPVARM
jgi:hypothetical protein